MFTQIERKNRYKVQVNLSSFILHNCIFYVNLCRIFSLSGVGSRSRPINQSWSRLDQLHNTGQLAENRAPVDPVFHNMKHWPHLFALIQLIP